MSMEQLIIYKVNIEESEDSFILEYNINDKFESKRYYFLSFKTLDIYRIKNIDDFIEYCELNNINISKLDFSEKELNVMLELIENTMLRNKNNKFKDVNSKYAQYFYNSLDTSFNDYDYRISKDIVKKNKLFYNNSDIFSNDYKKANDRKY